MSNQPLKLTAANLQRVFGTRSTSRTPSAGSMRSARSSSARSMRGGFARASKGRRAKSNRPRKGGMKRIEVGAFKDNMNKVIGPLVAAINTAKNKVALSKSAYFDAKDSKFDLNAVTKEIDQLSKELVFGRTALRSGLGDKPVRIRLSAPMVLTTTVTTGVTKTVNIAGSGSGTLDPINCDEWNTVAALFDEFKCLGGEVVFIYCNPSSMTTANNLTSDNIPTMGYDGGAGGATAVSVMNLTQLAQHKSFVNWTAQSIGAGMGMAPVLHRFKWHVPKGTVVSLSNTNIPGTEWQTTDSPAKAGTLLFYHIGLLTTAVNSGAGWTYMDFEFRCRQ